MIKRQRQSLLRGFVLGATVAGSWWLYDQRPRVRVSGKEGLEDLEIAQAFGRVAKMPHMRLLRRYAIRRAIPLKARGAAIDLGCGPGDLVVELATQAPGLRVTGVDLSEEMLAQSRTNARRTGVADRVAFRSGDAGHIPFEDDALDMVISTLSLHHWQDPPAVLDEIARVLRPGGAFMILDLRRDLSLPAWLLVWFATQFVVPEALRRMNEPLGSRNAAYTPEEAAELALASRLTGWRIVRGPLWLIIEGTTVTPA